MGGTSVMTLTDEQLDAFLQRVCAPALFIRAPDGLVLDEHVLAKQAASIRRLQRVSIPGGHHVHMERAPLVAEAIATWLNPHTSAALRDPKGD